MFPFPVFGVAVRDGSSATGSVERLAPDLGGAAWAVTLRYTNPPVTVVVTVPHVRAEKPGEFFIRTGVEEAKSQAVLALVELTGERFPTVVELPWEPATVQVAGGRRGAWCAAPGRGRRPGWWNLTRLRSR